MGGSLQGKHFERSQGTVMLFQFQVSEANLVSPKERQGVYFKETGLSLGMQR